MSYSGLFEYYKPLMPTARSQMTLDYDLGNNLRITKKIASNLFELHYKKHKSIIYEKDYLTSFINEFKVDAKDYDDFMIGNDNYLNSLNKHLYSIESSDFIYVWIECYKSYMDQQTLRNLQKIISEKYNSNKTVDEFIRRDSLKNELVNFGGDAFMKFYDYCRLQYLRQNTMQFNYIPKFYNPSTGTLYFTTKNKIKWEHIFERICTNTSFIVKYIPTLINNKNGIFSITKNLKTNKWNQEISIGFEVPNFVRYSLEYILLKNRNIEGLDEAKVFAYKKCIMTEDFCKKSIDGSTMNMPSKNSWQMMGGKELRSTPRSSIDLNTVYDSYDSKFLNPVLQGCWC